MDYQKQQAEAIKAANELKGTANKLQQKMINEMEANNRVTSTHNKMMSWLTVAIVFLACITLFTNYNKTGRYAIATLGPNGVFVLDTKTSQLWLRTESTNIYLGINKNPKHILVKSEDEQKQ